MSLSEPSVKKRKLNDNTKQNVNNDMSMNNDYNICNEVRDNCKMVYLRQASSTDGNSKQDVWIDEKAIESEVNQNSDTYIKQSLSELQWRKDPYHYFDADDVETTLRFILVLDALNFCFWPLNHYEYEHLGSGLKHTLQADKSAFSPSNLMTLTPSTLSKWLLSKFDHQTIDKTQSVQIPLIEERSRLLNEVGRVIHFEYEDKVTQFVQSANGSAVKLVELMTKKLRGFADHCIDADTGKQIVLYKRAQIFVADIYAAFEGESVGKFKDIEQLTCFADYRVPQLLRSLNILKYSSRLSEIIDSKQLLRAGSRDEVLIRSSTIYAVEKLKHCLNAKRKSDEKKEFISIEIDWYLWNRGEQLNIQNKLQPHHRTLTVYY